MDHSHAHTQSGKSRAAAEVMQKKTAKTAAKGFPAVSQVAQLYRSKSNAALGTNVQSTNGVYFLNGQSGNDAIFVAAGGTAPIYSTLINADVDGLGTSRYEPQDTFLADCLHTAEEIMSGGRLVPGGVHSQETSQGTAFGDTEAMNWTAAEHADDDSKDKKASPAIGESYAIVEDTPRDFGGFECQYHAAAVVAQDDTDNITLEVFGNPTSRRRSATGGYAIYSSSPRTRQTFHSIWSGSFPNGVTIELGYV